jgi:hypothetical protein
MPKYYVSSGDLRAVIDAATPWRAAVAAIRRIPEEEFTLANAIVVSEVGFPEVRLGDQWIATVELLDEFGLRDEFQFNGDDAS